MTTTYSVRYKCGCLCGHRHRTPEAAEACEARTAEQHHAMHADRCQPGRRWGTVRYLDGIEG